MLQVPPAALSVAPSFQTPTQFTLGTVPSFFSLEEVKSFVYLTKKILGIPPGPSLNITKRPGYCRESCAPLLPKQHHLRFRRPGGEALENRSRSANFS